MSSKKTPSRKSAAKKATAKKATPARKTTARKAAAAPADDSPVTLAQARSLAAAQSPARPHAVKAAAAATGDATTLAEVGRKKRELRLQRRKEDQQRIRDYKATMAIMKKRGVKGLAAETGGKAPRRPTGAIKASAAGRPLQIFAEGDSWFDYPVPFFGGGIIPRLEDLLGVPILNLAKAGDEVRYMLGVEQRVKLIKQLQQGCPAGGAWEVLLFSGGGNDIVDNPMALWVRDYKANVPAARLIHQDRYQAALALVRAGYEDLISLRDWLSPSTHLVFHAYDFAIPDGRGVCHLGPWLKPTFDLRGFPALSSSFTAFEVVKAMLQQFAAMLQSLADAHRKVTFINGQGTLPLGTNSWHNELHPSKDGFKTFAAVFHQKLRTLFPNRVL